MSPPAPLIVLLLLLKNTNAFIIPSIKTSFTITPASSSYTTTTAPTQHAAAAASREEDLELTRQIIMEHIAKQDYNAVDDDDDEEESKVAKPKDSGNQQKPLMVRAALGDVVERTPVWLFRQAGRHLPEYREYKDKVGRNFLEMLQFPEDVAECTLQPLRRYDLDAAILFSDILVIPQAIGMSVTMPGGVGIQVPHPLSTPADIDDYDLSTDAVMSKLSHVIESVSLIKTKMTDEGFAATPLIGFSAAPFTLLFYMVGGSSKKNPDAGVRFLKSYPEEAKKLLDDLTSIVVEYLVAQVENGADMIQLFEAMGMMIDEETFLEYELSCLERIARELKERLGGDVPLMVFARGAGYANTHLAKLPYDVITIDGSASRETIRKTLPNVTLQGNYDPKELIAEEGKTPESVRATAVELLRDLQCQKLIANLGEGLGGRESPELVKVFVDCIHEESEKMIKEGQDA